MPRSKNGFTYQGEKYQSKTACAIHLMSSQNLSMSAAAKAVGISSQTVGSYTKYKDKRNDAAVRRWLIAKALEKKYSVGDLAKKKNMHPSKVMGILKKAGVKAPSADEIKALQKAKEAADAEKSGNVQKAKSSKPRKSKKAKSAEQPESQVQEPVSEISEPVAEQNPEPVASEPEQVAEEAPAA
jgi:transcriptional regulator with XRE-family HTH domain